jgi:hypothetical protein
VPNDERTRADEIINRIKNNPILAWIVVIGIGVVGLAKLATSVSDIRKTLSRDDPHTKATVSELPKDANKPAQPAPARVNEPSTSGHDIQCRFVLFPQFGQYGQDTVTINFDGSSELVNGRYWSSRGTILILKQYDEGRYKLRVKRSFEILKNGREIPYLHPTIDKSWTGDIIVSGWTLLQYVESSPQDLGFTLKPVSKNELARFLEHSRLRLPDCEPQKSGPTWLRSE